MSIKSLIRTIIKNNDFYYSGNPMIVVFRNTDIQTGAYLEDTGENAMDGFILFSKQQSIVMQGRTRPNRSYLDKFFADGVLTDDETFNYVAPCYLKFAFKKGPHQNKYPALRQNRKFPVMRSLDEILANDDDFPVYEWPCDNFHGWLKSRGCWSVAGKMTDGYQTGDWKIAFNWIYNEHQDINEFDALCLERFDFESPDTKRVRFGSQGPRVQDLQRSLKIKPDGDFGYMTLSAVIEYQVQNGINVTGVI